MTEAKLTRDSKVLPSISMHGKAPVVRFDSIPLWEGVHKFSGIRNRFPFVLSAMIDSPIRQITSEQIVNCVVGAYKSDEYKFITAPPGASSWASSLGERNIVTVESVIGDDRPNKFLEIGGGSTWVACRLKKRYNPESYYLVDPAVRNSAEGIKVIREYFPNPQLENILFDVILGFHVLEHVLDPLLFLRNIRKHLTIGGKVILTYPDCEFQLSHGDLNVLVHEHLSFFTEASSRWIASVAGFKVLSLNTTNNVFTLVLEARSEDSHPGLKLDESKLILRSAKIFTHLLTKKADLIRQHLECGEYVGFHGATPGLNTFLALTGLGSHPGIRIYDGDISKEGLYLPACSTPIKSSKDKSYIENSLVVISALAYCKDIRQFAIEKAGFDPRQILPLIGGSKWQ